MDASVEKLTAKTGKSPIDPIYDTNWCDLPPEMKIQCIERMELKERLLLRSTCKTERTLVDSQKLKIACAEFSTSTFNCCLSIKMQKESSWTHLKFPKEYNYKLIIPLIEYLLKVGIFDELTLYWFPATNYSDNFQGSVEPYSVNKFSVVSCSEKDLFYWLNALKNEVEAVILNVDGNDDFPFDKLLTVPKIINTQLLQITYLYRSDSAYKVAQIWMDNDVEIGQTFLVLATKGGSIDEFSNAFSDRTISKTDDRIRIRTENSKKHILLEFRDDDEDWDYTMQLIRLLVIPAEMKESEYEKDNREWVKMLYPNYYFPEDAYEILSSSDDSSDSSDSYDSFDSDESGEWEFDSDDN